MGTASGTKNQASYSALAARKNYISELFHKGYKI